MLWSECILPTHSNHILKPNSQALRRQSFKEVISQEGGALVNGISALVKETCKSFLPTSTA